MCSESTLYKFLKRIDRSTDMYFNSMLITERVTLTPKKMPSHLGRIVGL